MKLCVLKCILDGYLCRLTGIVDKIEDNVINEKTQKQLIIVTWVPYEKPIISASVKPSVNQHSQRNVFVFCMAC